MTLLFYAPEQLNGNLSENISVLSRFTSQSPAVCPCHYIPLDLHFLGTSLLSADLRSPWVFSSVLLSLLSSLCLTFMSPTNPQKHFLPGTPQTLQSPRSKVDITNQITEHPTKEDKTIDLHQETFQTPSLQMPRSQFSLSLLSFSLPLHVLWHEQTRQYPSFRSLQPLLQQAPRKSSQ